jgi:hypothetical protein
MARYMTIMGVPQPAIDLQPKLAASVSVTQGSSQPAVFLVPVAWREDRTCPKS